MLDLRADDLAAGTDGGERADVAVDDAGARTDHGGAADDRALHLGALLDHDPALDPRALVDQSGDRRLDGLEHEAVALEERGEHAGVLPPAVEDLVAHPVALVDQPLDGVGDLELAAGGGLDGAHRLVDGAVEEVDADEGEVRRRVGRLLDQRADRAVVGEGGHAEALRVGHAGQQDLRGRTASGRRPRRPPGAASKASANSLTPWRRRLSPRYITKSSSPRKSPAISTQWARPSGSSCGM